MEKATCWDKPDDATVTKVVGGKLVVDADMLAAKQKAQEIMAAETKEKENACATTKSAIKGMQQGTASASEIEAAVLTYVQKCLL